VRVRFHGWTLDTGSRELLRDGAAAHLTGKAFRLLQVLVEHRPQALSKDQLQDLVWPGVFVTEANLTSLITELRKVMGERAHEPRFIRTVYGFGYAFCAEVVDEAVDQAAKWPLQFCRYRLIWGRREILLRDGENVLGRGPDSIEAIDRDTVSRRHARIFITADTVTIEDLGSKNGTRLCGRRLEGTVALSDGDEIRLGSVTLTLRVVQAPRSTATASSTSR
jgi:DNA-binding winged helix-turn-helix (wHTH) protein